MLKTIFVSNVGLGLHNTRKLPMTRCTRYFKLYFYKEILETNYAAFYHFKQLVNRRSNYQNGRANIARDVLWQCNRPTKLSIYPSEIAAGISRSFHSSSVLRNINKDNNKSNDFGGMKYIIPVSVVMCAALIGMGLISSRGKNVVIMSWEQFARDVLPSGEVKRVHINTTEPHKAVVSLHSGATFYNRKVNVIEVAVESGFSFEEKLQTEEKRLGIAPSSTLPISKGPFDEADVLNFGIALSFFLTSALVTLTLISRKRPPMPKRTPSSSPQEPFSFNIFKMFDTDVGYAQNTNVKFKDVAGMKEAKQEVMEFVEFLKNPEHYQRLGAKMPRGCLLTGPPGVGKTLLAKAVASEAGVPFIAKAGSDFVEMIGGLGARRVRQLFEKARESAPCIIYIDELDALGAARSASGTRTSSAASEKDQTLNQILVEMDGMLSQQHQVIVLASTNRVDILDKALLRPGRFDRLIHIDLPNRIERKQILARHLQDVKIEGTPDKYSSQLANETPGMSGADLANICNEAAIYAARENDDVVEWKHLHYALERVTSGAPKSTTSLSPEERRKVAVHESGHALVGWLLEHTNVLAKVTIIPRSKGALGITRTVQPEKFIHSEEQLFDNMCMALGGRAAENIVFNHVTQGAQDDLEKVTKMAYSQVKHYGFNNAIGPLSFQQEGDLQVRPYSEALAAVIDMEAKKLVAKAYERSKTLLEENRFLLDKLFTQLLAQETLTYDDVVKIIGPPPFEGKKQIKDIPFDDEINESSDSGIKENNVNNKKE